MLPAPILGRRVLLWLRVAFAVAGFGSEMLLSPVRPPWGIAISAAFLVFSLLLPLRKTAYGGAFALLVLFADTVFFLALVAAGIGAVVWLPAFCCLYLLGEAVFFYRPPEVLIVAVVSTTFCMAVQSDQVFIVRRTSLMMGLLAYAFSIYKKKLESHMEQIVEQASQTEAGAQRARKAERERIASDFHDGPLQSFIALQMRLEILRKILERDFRAGMDDLTDLQKVAQQQVKELRAFVRSMRPMDLAGSNLYASARRICENFQKESGIPVTFVGGEGPLRLPPDAGSELAQMLSEALHNVLKHASATRVAVALEQVGKSLELSVDDNGHGFHFSGVYTLDELELLRLGPASFKRRARALNADMTLESRPGRGAGLKLRVPLP
jgi:signal transduction histidine kinase